MTDTTFTIGAAATCSDGPCGAVSRVVVDPVARELTHLVIEPEHRSGLGRLVPLEMVESESDGVHLRYTLAEFDKLPSAEEMDFLPGGSGYDAYEAHEAYYWPYFGLEGGSDPQLALASAVETRDKLPPGEFGVQRGQAVHATDGEIGKVEGLVVDSGSGSRDTCALAGRSPLGTQAGGHSDRLGREDRRRDHGQSDQAGD